MALLLWGFSLAFLVFSPSGVGFFWFCFVLEVFWWFFGYFGFSFALSSLLSPIPSCELGLLWSDRHIFLVTGMLLFLILNRFKA